MAQSKRKFIQWTYRDEATNKEHPIQVYTLVDDDKVSFEAEVRTPVRFTDRDENANVLKLRVLARCAQDLKLEWKPYILVTTSHEGFDKEPLAFNSMRRNYYSIGLLFEPFEAAIMADGTQIWRGIAGKSTRYGTEAKPGWPEHGKLKSGNMCCYFEDTPENRRLLEGIQAMFSEIRRALASAFKPANVNATLQTLIEYEEIWNKFRPEPAATSQEAACQQNGSNSAQPEPSATVGSALSTANASLAT